jgi:hypothetical protein
MEQLYSLVDFDGWKKGNIVKVLFMTIKGTKIPIGQERVFLAHQIGHAQSFF